MHLCIHPVALKGAYVSHLVSLNFHNAKCIQCMKIIVVAGRKQFTFLNFTHRIYIAISRAIESDLFIRLDVAAFT